MNVLRFHECPECGRLSPYLQSRCECGYRFTGSESQYKTCSECGSIIPSGQVICDCGHITLPSFKKSSPQSPAIPRCGPDSTRSHKDHRDFSEKRRLQIFIVGSLSAAILLFISVLPIILPDNKSNADGSDFRVSFDSLMPKTITNGHIVEYPSDEMLAPLGIYADSSSNFYIRLRSLDNSSNDMGFLVKRGDMAEVSVPLGEYEIYYATGESWYGPDYLFGEETRRYQCEGTFDFYDDGEYYQGWTLELYLQDNGNMDSDPIDASQWPS